MTLQHRWLTPACARHAVAVCFFVGASLLFGSLACGDTISSYNLWQWNGFTRTASLSSEATSSYSSSFLAAPISSLNAPISSLTGTSTTSGASLSGTIYYDVNGNGVLQSNDMAIHYAEVSLSLAGSTVTSTYTTGKDGTYTFAGLAATAGTSTYTLTLLTVSNSGGTTSAGLINGSSDNVANALEYSISNIVLPTDAVAINYDFAEDSYPISLISKRLLMGSSPGIENTPGVPEPGTLALLAVAGLSLAGFAWRRLRKPGLTT